MRFAAHTGVPRRIPYAITVCLWAVGCGASEPEGGLGSSATTGSTAADDAPVSETTLGESGTDASTEAADGSGDSGTGGETTVAEEPEGTTMDIPQDTGEPDDPAAWPDASNTGVPSGTVLKPCAADIVEPGVYDGCQFDGTVTLYTDGVTIRNSKVDGIIRSDLSDLDDVLLEDVEIDAHDDIIFNAIGLDGYTCRRCQVHDARVCFGGKSLTIEDSYCYDLHGEGDPATTGTHNEAIIASGTRPIVIRNNNLVANWNDTTTGGGMSAVIAIYSHGIWGPLGNVTVEHNRLQSISGAAYCMYSGQQQYGPSGISVVDNLFVLDDPQYGMGCSSPTYPDWVQDPINIWSDNVHEDGTVIAEPAG